MLRTGTYETQIKSLGEETESTHTNNLYLASKNTEPCYLTRTPAHTEGPGGCYRHRHVGPYTKTIGCPTQEVSIVPAPVRPFRSQRTQIPHRENMAFRRAFSTMRGRRVPSPRAQTCKALMSCRSSWRVRNKGVIPASESLSTASRS